MNKEVHYEGWLIKSPPTRRIWRARWRRRWFTLKQGEIPEQFCLEYYTDRNCRKLKGVIDLDQCEQVDCGLRLENRKQKFQYMFDIKTPKRTYYLAADTESDMRDWVNCICQVCHLHDTKQSSEIEVVFGNCTISTIASPEFTPEASVISCSQDISQQPPSGKSSGIPEHAVANDTMSRHQQGSNANSCQSDCVSATKEICQVSANESHFDQRKVLNPNKNSQQQSVPQQNVALYLNSSLFYPEVKKSEENNSQSSVNVNGIMRKIPENLVLDNVALSDVQHSSVPLCHSSVASNPYIPISECYSGSPKFNVDNTSSAVRLNNLDPKFYDTPRSRENIGLNLTNDQSYSPKITNCNLPQILTTKNRNHKSDSDSESVFTDDEEWTNPLPLRETDRTTRPSDSSVENESYVLTYSQRFSKIPDDSGAAQKNGDSAPNSVEKKDKVLKNKNNLVLDIKENSKVVRDLPQLSDTENTSPAIRPRIDFSVVEESYDIPRSHNLPYCNMTQSFDKVLSPIVQNQIALSSPNLMDAAELGSMSPGNLRKVSRPHYYTNAAPKQVEENVFRYDFDEQGNLPPVNRSLKPKVNLEDKPPEDVPAKPPTKATAAVAAIAMQRNTFQSVDNAAIKSMPMSVSGSKQSLGATTIADSAVSNPPLINRTLKPTVYRIVNPSTTTYTTSSARSSTVFLPSEDESHIAETQTLPRQSRSTYTPASSAGCDFTYENTGLATHHQRTTSALAATQLLQAPSIAPQKSMKNEHKLQYFELDVSNPPAIHRQSISVGNLKSTDVPAPAPVNSSVVYNSVDFVKTEAFKRIREERKKKSDGLNSTN